jgi:cobalt-zinc-cadmium efflux system protein
VHTAHTPGSRHKHRLRSVLALTGGFLLVEVVVAVSTGSLSLLADAAHMLVDAGGLLMSLVAVWFAERPATPAKTYGYYRVEILAALVNGVVLCLLAAGILIKAYERLWQPPHVAGAPILVVAALGLAVNLVGMALLRSGAGESLNVRGAYLELLGDAASSAAVIVAGAVILLTGWAIADPLASGAIALLILPRTWTLLRQAVNVLLEGARRHRDRVGAVRGAGGAAHPRPARVDADLGARGHERSRRGGTRHLGRSDPRGAARHPARPLRHRPHHHPGRDRAVAAAPHRLPARVAGAASFRLPPFPDGPARKGRGVRVRARARSGRSASAGRGCSRSRC